MNTCVLEAIAEPLYVLIPRPSTTLTPLAATETTTVLDVSIEFVSKETVSVFIVSFATFVDIPEICT